MHASADVEAAGFRPFVLSEQPLGCSAHRHHPRKQHKCTLPDGDNSATNQLGSQVGVNLSPTTSSLHTQSRLFQGHPALNPFFVVLIFRPILAATRAVSLRMLPQITPMNPLTAAPDGRFILRDTGCFRESAFEELKKGEHKTIERQITIPHTPVQV